MVFRVTQAALQFLKLEAEEIVTQWRELFWSKKNNTLLLRSLVTDYQQSLIKHSSHLIWPKNCTFLLYHILRWGKITLETEAFLRVQPGSQDLEKATMQKLELFQRLTFVTKFRRKDFYKVSLPFSTSFLTSLLPALYPSLMSWLQIRSWQEIA